MIRSKHAGLLAGLMATGLIAGNVAAETVSFKFTGKVTSVDAALGETAKPGDGCTVIVTFDPNTAPVFAGLPRYPVLESSFTVHTETGDLEARSMDGPQEQIIINDRSGAFQTDQWLWSALSGDGFGNILEQFQSFSLGEHAILDYNIHLTDNTATAFDSGQLPATLDLTAFQLRQGFAQFGTAGHDLRFSVDKLELVEDESLPSEEPTDIEITTYSYNEEGTFTMKWRGPIGQKYELIRSVNLVDWEVLSEVTASGEITSATVSRPANDFESGFFGIRVQD